MTYASEISGRDPAIKIRVMYHDEIYNVLNLIHFSIHKLNSKDYNPQQIEKIACKYNKASLKGGIVLIAEQDSQVIGVAKASFSGFIQAVFIHPNFIRQGVGRALVCELERRVCLKNCKRLSVMSSLTAVDFYVALGYKRLGEVNIYGDVPCVLLEKQFKPYMIIDRIWAVYWLILFFGILVFAIAAFVRIMITVFSFL